MIPHNLTEAADLLGACDEPVTLSPEQALAIKGLLMSARIVERRVEGGTYSGTAFGGPAHGRVIRSETLFHNVTIGEGSDATTLTYTYNSNRQSFSLTKRSKEMWEEHKTRAYSRQIKD